MDGTPSFDDFKPFGGWTRPAMKVYSTETVVCGRVDISLYYQP